MITTTLFILISSAITILLTIKFKYSKNSCLKRCLNRRVVGNIIEQPTELIEKMKEIEESDNSKILLISDALAKSSNEYTDDYIKERIMDLDNCTEDTFFKWLSTDYDENKTLHIVIHTTGGQLDMCNLMTNLLISHKGPINTYVPFYAYSAGAMIVLIGKTSYMKSYAVLSPIDPQLVYYDLKSNNQQAFATKTLIQLPLIKDSKCINDVLLLNIIESKKIHDSNQEILKRLLASKNLSTQITETLLQKFASGDCPHVTQYTVKELRDWGLDIKTEIPIMFEELFTIYRKIV